MPTSDIAGNAQLCADLTIPIMLGEQLDDLNKYAELIRNNTTDILRCILERVGEITAVMKLTHFIELHAMKMEPHNFGTQAMQFAHLQVMLAMENSDLFEASVPQEGTFDTVITDACGSMQMGSSTPPRSPDCGPT